MSSPSRRNGFRAVFQVFERHHRIPEAAQHVLSGGQHVLSPPAFLVVLGFALGHAVVPGAEREPRQHHHGEKQRDARDRDQEQRCEHPRDFELEARLQDLVGQAGVAPPVPATNSATTAPISASPLETRSPAKKNGRRARDAQINQLLQPRRAVDGKQVLMALIDAAQPHRGVRR